MNQNESQNCVALNLILRHLNRVISGLDLNIVSYLILYVKGGQHYE